VCTTSFGPQQLSTNHFNMDRTLFRALPLPSEAEDAAPRRLLEVARAFDRHFGRPPAGIARAPGRVNLIGEHVDYEGYAVLPMAIEQSVFVAFNAIAKLSSSEVKVLSVANAKPQYRAVSLSMDDDEQENMQKLEAEGASWAKYVLCGVLGVQDARVFRSQEKELQMMVDGDIPAGCGLSSSSALVVAAALATYSALQTSGDEPLGRMELAELCRRAEHRVGTIGGGMDQAVACLAAKGVALHLDFATVPAKSSPVRVPDDAAGVTFVVANSLVVAEKAVDAATRFNKRVVECALAAKLIVKKAGLDGWRDVRGACQAEGRSCADAERCLPMMQINRLVDVQEALGSAGRFADLLKLVMDACKQEEYSLLELEAEFGEPIAGLFTGSKLETAAQVRWRGSAVPSLL
jgi:N-acetylgalactosamine kinase